MNESLLLPKPTFKRGGKETFNFCLLRIGQKKKRILTQRILKAALKYIGKC